MMKRKQDGFKPTNPSGGVKKLKQTSTYFSDTRLIPRIRQYLNAHKNRKVVSITSMTEDLQRQYSEYARKKKNAFIKSVEKAYEIISTEDKNYKDTEDLEDEYLKRKNKQRDVGSERDQPNEDDDEKSYSSDNDYAEYEDQNSMNNLMSNLYRNSPARTTPALPNNTKAGSAPTSANNNSGLSLGKGDNSASLMEESLFFIDKDGDSENILNSTQQDETESVSSKTSKKRKITKKTKNKDEEKEKAKKGPEIQTSTVKFEDFGGNEKCLVEVCKLLVHMRHPEVYQQLGVTPPRGFLLHGPPGCGKTLLAHAIAGELELPFIKLAATEIVTGVSGESEEKIRDLFDKAAMSAPCIVFMDEIDAITPKRETASKDMERRIVAQLLSCLDDLNNKKDVHVLVIGATNRPDSLDPALRRAGRFDREIALGIPDEGARCRILQVLCRNLKLEGDFDFTYLARNTPGYVGADLNALTREAALTAVNRVFNEIQKNDEDYEMTEVNSDDTNKNNIIPTCKSETAEKSMVSESYQQTISESVSETTEEQTISESVLEETEKQTLSKSVSENINIMCKTTVSKEHTELQSVLGWLKEHPPLNEHQLQSLCITFKDFEEAMKVVQPSAKREGFATIPDVTWEDIGALQTVREELQLAIMAPIRHPEKFKDLGLNKAQGILLAGPPGCGKTLLAKAISNESGINFISVKGPELLNMYVGESERAVRQVFQRARNSSPCVIFFDELDALCPRRTDGGEGGSSVRVVNQLLTEMDGLEERKQVFIIGATNRPDIIDPAIMRPGRLDKTLYVGLPTPEDRLDIFMTITKKGTRPKLSTEVNLEEVASDPRCQGYSGADLAALIREASVCALKDAISCTSEKEQPSLDLTKAHFEQAFTKVRPSVSSKDHQKYEKIKDKMT